MKKCSKCKIEKPLDDFHKDSSKKDGLCSKCKPCFRAYYKANKERIAEYKEANQDMIAKYNKAYLQANRKKINEQKKEYSRNRRKNDPLYKLKANLRSRTNIAFKAGGYSKNSKTQEMLGVDWEVVSAHIERQFTEGMTWDNYGKWHVDHVIPLASAKTEKEIRKLCHYSNLQPLWAEENLRKNGRIEHGTQSMLRL